MQESKLSPVDVATLTKALTDYALINGPRILGAQLGNLIGAALQPRSARELGTSNRAIIATELSHLLKEVDPAPNASDRIFHVVTGSAAATIQRPLTPPPDSLREIAGRELWQCFSNPNISCQLFASTQGTVLLGGIDTSVPEEFRSLTRLTSDDYRRLAQAFIDSVPSEFREVLQGCIGNPDFYNPWIAALRALRTPSRNLLKDWEVRRSEFIASKLSEALFSAGVLLSHAVEMVSLARPSRVAAVTSPENSQEPPQPVAEPPAIEVLRKLAHAAIDQMSLSELRDLKIPVGLLYDAQRRGQD